MREQDWRITGAEAQLIYEEAMEQTREVAFFLMIEPEYPGRYVARFAAGAEVTPYVMVTSTIEELRMKLPAGLVCRHREPDDPIGLIEIWVPPLRDETIH